MTKLASKSETNFQIYRRTIPIYLYYTRQKSFQIREIEIR